MSNIRLIPRLDIKGPNLVKGIHLEGLRIMGNPHDYAMRYYHRGADELLYVDIVASLYQRNNINDIVRATAHDIFIPMTLQIIAILVTSKCKLILRHYATSRSKYSDSTHM